MTDDEVISTWPPGYRHTFLCISLAKRALTTPDIKTGEQLKLLQQINDCIDLSVSREMVEIIEPMSDLEFKMYSEAAALDHDENLAPSFAVLTSPQTFRTFSKVNPSYVAALKLGHRPAPGKA
jgi:hypothetical protein